LRQLFFWKFGTLPHKELVSHPENHNLNTHCTERTDKQPQQRASRQTHKQENTKKREGKQNRNKTQMENTQSVTT
jgi:hypothetical protein